MLQIALAIAAVACGEERSAVRVVNDAEAHRVLTGRIVRTSVESLCTLNAPAFDEGNPRAFQERLVFQMHARVVAHRLREDGAFELVVAGTAGTRMRVELPAAECASDSRFAERIAEARSQLVAIAGAPKASLTELTRPVWLRLRGIGFFARPAPGDPSEAPNGMRLAPVVEVVASDAAQAEAPWTAPAESLD